MSDNNKDELAAYKTAYLREKKARQVAEKLLDDKTRELYDNVLDLESVVAKLKQTQSQLVQSEKMASLGQLTAGIAHEINNPIGFSYSNLSCLSDYLKDFFSLDNIIQQADPAPENAMSTLAAYQAQYKELNAGFIVEDSPFLLQDTLEGLERVKNLIANLKKISYKGNDEFTSCDINECINDCLKVVKNELKYSMKIDLHLGQCSTINGQAPDLNQVFINLFINASHACSYDGVLTITTEEKDQHVFIHVKDNGKGIPEDSLKKIFDPFYTTKVVGEGTGLGLSISHGIIEKHGGEILVKSTENVGTCFTIKLPIALD
ncbi:sensor histidine kinase [Thalassotalea sp. PLHSN55]|uniref:sensor histidine kinase n=1 Tax=Thalassotalea sp. PLHSN55 TaxID=3435888 RepID=UPI003F8267E4